MRFDAFSPARALLLAGAAIVPAAAQAQDTPAAAAQADSEDMNTGNEIIVTATKREQTLQETPVAVSVTTAQTIERAQIRDIADLATLVPSLRVSTLQSPFATSYSVRGFGTDGNNLGLEPSVAVFVDGVYRSRAIAQISDLPDIQRVEVLRGPQSTLFGKNASAGVISIVTRKPAFDLRGSLEASYGNYNAFVAKGYVTGPISETIAASIAGGYNRRDGYVTNAFNGDDLNNRGRWFARGQVLFEPSGDLSFRVIGDYDQINEKCCAVFNIKPSSATQAVRAVGGNVNDFTKVPRGDVVYSDVVPTNRIRNWGISGQGDYSFGALKLTSITAYRETRLDANQDVDFTSARLASGANIGKADIKTFTQEVRLTSEFDGPLNFLLGGYYFTEKLQESDTLVYGADFRNYANLLIQGATGGTQSVASLEATLGALNGKNYTGQFFAAGQGFANSMSQKNDAYSIFGNVDFDVTDRLTITLGANYTKDRKVVSSNSLSTDVFAGVDLTASGRTAIFSTLLGRAGINPANPAQVQAFAQAQPALFAQFQSIAAYNATLTPAAAAVAPAITNPLNVGGNPFLPLRPLQFLPPFQNFPNAVEDGRTSDGKWTYVARAAYEVSNTLNAYVSYATGFKASSWNLSRDSRPTAADFATLVARGLAVTNLVPGSRFAKPENSEVYELGIKGNWGLASANLTFFKQSIKNFQTNTFTGVGFIFANADKQSTFGVEFDGLVRPVDELTLTLAMTYLDPKYDSFVNSPLGDLSGTKIGSIPKISATWGAQWDQDIGDGNHLILAGDFTYSSPVQLQAGLLNFITVNPDGSRNYDTARAAARPYRAEYTLLNASLTYAFRMGLEVSLWGRNLLDDRNITTIFDSVAQAGSISGYTSQPRTYGVSARFKF